MQFSSQKLKEKMLELTRLFCIERNIFQKFVIIYRYIRLLNKDPLAKEIMQKIFNETIKLVGDMNAGQMDEKKFLSVKGEVLYTNEFWLYYSNLELIHQKMKNLKQCQISDKSGYDNLYLLFSKPYSKEMLELSFKVINSNIFDHLDQECFFKENELQAKNHFDEESNVLYIDGEAVKIGKNRRTNQHKILKYIFLNNKNNLSDDFYFSEMAADEFGDLEYSKNRESWRRYYDACGQLRLKIMKQTQRKIQNFLILESGQAGKVKINPEYL